VSDIIELIDGDHRRIRRLLSAVNEGASRRGVPRHALGLWGRVSELIVMHMAAEDEIWYPALYSEGQLFRITLPDCGADHNDIREVLAEANLETGCSRQWWLAVRATTTLVTMHLEREDSLIDELAGNLLDRTSREQLGARWHRFVGAWIRDADLATPPLAGRRSAGQRLAKARQRLLRGEGARHAS
jgi:hypothetical protein